MSKRPAGRARRWRRAVIALGSNIGDRAGNLRAALRLLSGDPHLKLRRTSSFYLTSPVGPDQRAFVNAAAVFLTDYEPSALLAALQSVERGMGRPARRRRWGPRIIDLDILYFGRLVLRTPDLRVPHPRLHERLFVLTPLLEICPGLKHPALRKTTRSLLRRALLTWPEQKVTMIRNSRRGIAVEE